MKDWLNSKAYDDWKLNPPERKTTACQCAWCKEDLWFDEEYYELDDEILCEDCAKKWLKNRVNWVSESMARGY